MMKSWQRMVLEREGLSVWQIKPGEAYCWIDSKTIQFPNASENYALFLHEVAHALYPQPEGPFHNHYHGGVWASRFHELVDRYMMVRPLEV